MGEGEGVAVTFAVILTGDGCPRQALLRHGNPKGGPAPSLPHAAARDTNQEDTPA